MFGSNSNNNDKSQFCKMDIRKPKQYIKPTHHTKEVREVYEKIVDRSDGHDILYNQGQTINVRSF